MPSSYEQLIKALATLPGIGKRSAERIAQELVIEASKSKVLRQALQSAATQLCICNQCGNITDHESDPCSLCRRPDRNNTLICVVETPGDIRLIESSGGFTGKYFCLLGKISPMMGEAIRDERIQKLIQRIREERIEEVLLALNSDVESDATAGYISEILTKIPVKVTRLARGLPVGSGVSYSDPETLKSAISSRR